jgi:transposase
MIKIVETTATMGGLSETTAENFIQFLKLELEKKYPGETIEVSLDNRISSTQVYSDVAEIREVINRVWEEWCNGAE